jgi:hypothetical protein
MLGALDREETGIVALGNNNGGDERFLRSVVLTLGCYLGVGFSDFAEFVCVSVSIAKIAIGAVASSQALRRKGDKLCNATSPDPGNLNTPLYDGSACSVL